MFPDGDMNHFTILWMQPCGILKLLIKYVEYTGDYEFIKKHIYQGLKDIINSYASRDHFNIKMDKDFLITAGDANTQLTWMDAKVGDWVVTPRHGKAVEINMSLWYNALKVMANLSDKFGEDDSYYNDLASKVKKSFVEKLLE